MPKQPHILNAASNLLGIALLIIAGLNVSQIARHSIADEIAWVAAICLSRLFTLFAAIVTLAIERA
jgi:hypothetical protein